MSFAPLHSFDERELVNEYVCGVVAPNGTILTRDTTDLSVVGVGNRPAGRVTNGSISVAGDREIGFLMYPVTETGVTFFNQVTGTLDYSSAAETPCSILLSHPGMQIATSAFATSGTGALTVGQSSGNTSPDTLLGVVDGQYVLQSSFESGAGSIARAKLIRTMLLDNNIPAICVQVL